METSELQFNSRQRDDLSGKVLWMCLPLAENKFTESEENAEQDYTEIEEQQRVEEELEYLNSWDRILEII